MLAERNSKHQREVDILVQTSVAASELRFAIECRDRARPADIAWIDDLIGKYGDLPVDKIIAVSRHGFTEAALEKAAANRIDTLTLREALRTDWPKELDLLNVARVQIFVHPQEVTLFTDPPWPSGETPVAAVSADGEQPVADYFRECHDLIYREFLRHLEAEAGKTFHSLNDLNREHPFGFDLAVAGVNLIAPNTSVYRLDRMWWRCTVEMSTVDLPVRRELLGKIGITSADDHLPDVGAITTMVVQALGAARSQPVVFRRGSGGKSS
jgi:hypothetical protein